MLGGDLTYPKLHELDRLKHKALVEKCQENGWLMRGGYDWQDDPFLEEYPYDFVEAYSLDELRRYFAYGNMAIRQGVVYDDLAFIQQVNGGDEWWTLKQTGKGSQPDNWLDFESWSFYHSAVELKDINPDEFNRNIVSMQMASVSQCRELNYMLPIDSPFWQFSALDGVYSGVNELKARKFSAKTNGFLIDIADYPQLGAKATITSLENQSLICEIPYQSSALDVAEVSLRTASLYKERIVVGAKGREDNGFLSRVANVRESSLMLSKEDIDFLSEVLAK